MISVIRKFEFSSSYRMNNGFGGVNLDLYVAFKGSLNIETGMLVNIKIIKDKILSILKEYDHKCFHPDLVFNYYEYLLKIGDELYERCSSIFDNEICIDFIELYDNINCKIYKWANKHIIEFDYHFPVNCNGDFNKVKLDNHIYYVTLGLVKFLNVVPIFNSIMDCKTLKDITCLLNDNKFIKFIRLQSIDSYQTVLVMYPNVVFSKTFKFQYCHILNNPFFCKEENEKIYGKCNSLLPHGHSLGVDIYYSANLTPINKNMNFELCIQTYLHSFPKKYVPTGENLCRWLFTKLDNEFKINSLILKETNNNYFITCNEKSESYDLEKFMLI